MDVIPNLTVWGLALPILAVGLAVGVTLPRVLGPERSWGPLRDTGAFAIVYVGAVGVMMYVDIMLLHMGDGKFAEIEWFSFWSLYWPMWVALGVPMVSFAVLGVHLWRRVPPRVAYLSAVFIIVMGLQAAAMTGVSLSIMMAGEALAGVVWVVSSWLFFNPGQAHAV